VAPFLLGRSWETESMRTMTIPHSLASLPLLVVLGAAAGCASPRDAVPPGAHVETLQTRSLVLRGTAPAHPGSASCGSAGAAPSRAHLLELKEDTTGDIVLRPTSGPAVMHVALLGSSKTWCVTSNGDGDVSIPGAFAAGVYSISVEGSGSRTPLAYQVVFEQM
jgi:hypothetical protein